MASGGGDMESSQNGINYLNNFLMDPESSPRIKGLLVGLSFWAEVHSLNLKAHELLSQSWAYMHVPEGLLQTYEGLKRFEHEFSFLMARCCQNQDPTGLIILAKSGAERAFHAGDKIEAFLYQIALNMSVTKDEIRRNLRAVETAIKDYEQAIESKVGPVTFRKKLSKLSIPQPYPLDYIPITMEPYLEPKMLQSSGRDALFSVPLIFLRNRREHLLSLSQTLSDSGLSMSADDRLYDFPIYQNDVDLVDSELALVSSVQRMLNAVKMAEETRQSPDSTLTVDLFPEISEMVDTFTASLTHLHRGDRDRCITRSSSVNRLDSHPVTSDVLNNISSSQHTNSVRGTPQYLQLSSWMSSGEMSSERNAAPLNQRAKWFPETGSASNLNFEDRGNRWRPIPLYVNPPNSAFTRVVRNASCNNSNVRSRASSVTEMRESNSRHHNDIHYDSDVFHSHGAFGERQQYGTLQEVMNRLARLTVAVKNQSSVINENHSNLSDLVIAIEQLSRNVCKIQNDVALIASRIPGALMADLPPEDRFSQRSPLPLSSRNTIVDHWRNIEHERRRSDRNGMNILPCQGWDRDTSETRSSSSRVSQERNSNVSLGSNSGRLDRAESRPRVYEFRGSKMREREQADCTPNSNGGPFMLNNQIPPGNRANNYWDNFKSYSQLNLLSEPKNNAQAVSPAEHPPSRNILNDEIVRTSSGLPSFTRDPRGEQHRLSSEIRRSAAMEEFYSQKKRNKDQKKQLPSMLSGSPANSGSSNSSVGEPAESRRLSKELTPRCVLAEDPRREGPPKEWSRPRSFVSSPIEAGSHWNSLSTVTPNSSIARDSADVQELPVTTRPSAIISPPSSLEVDLVSRDEFLPLNSGAASSSSGNGRRSNEGGGPSSTSSKQELEKLLEMSVTNHLERYSERAGSSADELDERFEAEATNQVIEDMRRASKPMEEKFAWSSRHRDLSRSPSPSPSPDKFDTTKDSEKKRKSGDTE